MEEQKKPEETNDNKEVDEEVEVEILDAESDGKDEDESLHEDEESELYEKLNELKTEKEELEERILRIQAEYENFKRRSQKEKEASLKYKSQDLATDLLPVLDNFERALQVEQTEETKSLIEGITMVYNQLQEALENNGVEGIKTKEQEFDPNLHHAVMQEEDDAFESNYITEELQKGYMLKDRVIRPAMVKVNK